MPKYEVNFAKTIFATMQVEAEDEENAIEVAYEQLPQICAQCQGWGTPGFYLSADDEYQTLDEYYERYDPEAHGSVVKEIDEIETL